MLFYTPEFTSRRCSSKQELFRTSLSISDQFSLLSSSVSSSLTDLMDLMDLMDPLSDLFSIVGVQFHVDALVTFETSETCPPSSTVWTGQDPELVLTAGRGQ